MAPPNIIDRNTEENTQVGRVRHREGAGHAVGPGGASAKRCPGQAAESQVRRVRLCGSGELPAAVHLHPAEMQATLGELPPALAAPGCDTCDSEVGREDDGACDTSGSIRLGEHRGDRVVLNLTQRPGNGAPPSYIRLPSDRINAEDMEGRAEKKQGGTHGPHQRGHSGRASPRPASRSKPGGPLGLRTCSPLESPAEPEVHALL